MGLCTSSTAASTSDPAAGSGVNKEKGRKGNGGCGGGRGIVACGKRTDFCYGKNFEARYALGKLLGHGQFGYTFAAVDRHSDERVAVKRIDKNKVRRSKSHFSVHMLKQFAYIVLGSRTQLPIMFVR